MKTFSSPGGRAFASVKSANPDPARRFNADISEGFYTSAEGLIELGEWFIEQGQFYIEQAAAAQAEAEKAAKPKRRSKAKADDTCSEGEEE